MRTNNVSNTTFGSLKPISKKTYAIGGQALRDAEPSIRRMAKNVDMQVLAHQDPITGIKKIVIKVSELGKRVRLGMKKMQHDFNPILVRGTELTKDAIILAAFKTKKAFTEGLSMGPRATGAVFTSPTGFDLSKFPKTKDAQVQHIQRLRKRTIRDCN